MVAAGGGRGASSAALESGRPRAVTGLPPFPPPLRLHFPACPAAHPSDLSPAVHAGKAVLGLSPRARCMLGAGKGLRARCMPGRRCLARRAGAVHAGGCGRLWPGPFLRAPR